MAVAAMFAGTSSSLHAAVAAPKQDAIVFKDPKAIYKINQTGTIALATAFAATSKTPLTYTTSTPDIVSISGTTATIKAAGTASITAVYPASAPTGYIRANDLTRDITIAKAAAPKIGPVASNAKPVYAPGATLNITLPTGKGLPADYYGSLSYSVASGNATVDSTTGVVTLTGAGAIVVNVTPSASPNFATAATVAVKITAGLGVATINPITMDDTQYVVGKTVAIPTPTLSPNDATGGTFTFTTTSKTAKISGSTITLTGAGTVNVLAVWSGSAGKYAKTAKAVPVGSFNVSKADDVLTKTPIATPAPGASVALPALVSSPGKAKVLYTQMGGSGATVASGKVTPTNAGTGYVDVQGTTVATANFNAATPITYTVGWSYDAKTKKYTFSAQ